jgi:hypothetical protein
LDPSSTQKKSFKMQFRFWLQTLLNRNRVAIYKDSGNTADAANFTRGNPNW